MVYGSIDFGKTVVTNEKYVGLLEKSAEELKILPHEVGGLVDLLVEILFHCSI